MVVGIGIDLVEIERIKDMIVRFDQSFIDRVFTESEQQEAALRSDKTIYYAGRWAVKEAVSKALGTGIGAKCAFLDIECRNTPSGRPKVTLSGNGKKTFNKIGGKHIHLSLSHEETYAVSNVIIEN